MDFSTISPAAEWLERITTARRREKDWRKDAEEAVDIYEGCKKEKIAFNILYSNTETLVPALYNSTPRPVVGRRFKDADPIGKAAALVAQRLAEYYLDTNEDDYQPFDDAMVDGVLDAAVPGRACTRVRYDADIYERTEKAPALLKKEIVCYESIPWNRVVFGYSKKWETCPWMAFEHDITEDEAKKLFGTAIAAELKYVEKTVSEEEEDRKGDTVERNTGVKTARVYEIWSKDDRTIYFVSDSVKDKYLLEEDDPELFTNFFPIPKPLRFMKKSNNQLPTTLYSLYENQARELNHITIRINKVVEALKVRGVYDQTVEEIGQVFEQDDNKLVPAQNVAGLQDTNGLEKAIWLVPIEKYVSVLQQLYVAREACKQVIYEITGIADIMRGVSKASETLGAQELKDQWGTLRLKRMQKDVQRYARDLIRMTIEVAVKSLKLETIKQITGLPFPTMKDKQAAQAFMARIQAMAQMPGAPPPPPAPPDVQAAAASPAWEEILATLKGDLQRQYKIDIETNSTIDLAATEDKKDMAELMNAMSQFMNGVAPLVESGAMPFQAAQAMLLAIVRQFRFGPDVEDLLKQMQPPKPQGDGGAGALKEIKAQQQLAQANLQVQQVEQEKKDLERKVGLDLRDLDLKARKAELDHQEEMLMVKQENARRELELSQKAHLQEVDKTVGSALSAHKEAVAKQVDGARQEAGKAKVEAAGHKASAVAGGQVVKLQQQVLQSVAKLLEQQGKQHQELIKQLAGGKEKEKA